MGKATACHVPALVQCGSEEDTGAVSLAPEQCKFSPVQLWESSWHPG